MIRLELASTDNRDSSTTTLVMEEPGKPGVVYIVDIDPIDMFRNMLQNLPSPYDERLEWLLDMMVADIEVGRDDPTMPMGENGNVRID